MAKQPINSHNNTVPHPDLDWNSVRAEVNRPNMAAAKQHEADIARLDRVPEEKGGCGR